VSKIYGGSNDKNGWSSLVVGADAVGSRFLYHSGSQQNLEVLQKEETLWDQESGDKWLYVGGLMMLISGALAAAAVRVWSGGRRAEVISQLNVSRDRQDGPAS
jgi:hypothetical protein